MKRVRALLHCWFSGHQDFLDARWVMSREEGYGAELWLFHVCRRCDRRRFVRDNHTSWTIRVEERAPRVSAAAPSSAFPPAPSSSSLGIPYSAFPRLLDDAFRVEARGTAEPVSPSAPRATDPAPRQPQQAHVSGRPSVRHGAERSSR